MTITAEPIGTEQTTTEQPDTTAPVASATLTAPDTAAPALPGAYKMLAMAQVIVNENNIRDDAAAIPGITQNLIEDGTDGLIQPITVAPTIERALAESTPIEEQIFVIVEGEQRYWSAQEAAQEFIQAIIRWDYAGKRAQRIVMLRQVHRKDPTSAQQARGIEQLALDGMSEADIATATGFQIEEVRAGRAVAALDPAMADLVRKSDLNLIQQAMLKEFQQEDDRVVKRLVDAATQSPHAFARTVEYERNERATRQKVAARRTELTAAGITLLTVRPSYYDSKEIRPVTELRNADGPLTVESHTSCPGYRVFLSSTGSESHYCTGWRGHGHKAITAARTGTMSEQEKADRKRTIANNKAMEAANPVRRSEFIAPLLAGKNVPKDTAQFLAEIHDRDPGALGARASQEGRAMFDELVHPGKRRKPGSRNVPARISEARYQILTLASVAAAIECRITRESWRISNATVALWLSFCVHNGYDPDEVEQIIIDAHHAMAWNSGPRRRKRPATETVTHLDPTDAAELTDLAEPVGDQTEPDGSADDSTAAETQNDAEPATTVAEELAELTLLVTAPQSHKDDGSDQAAPLAA
ncbi:ParB/RepB/Spo0J family partition protein [Paractinoplanes hotanensis]|uniref:ParB/RepB/Spo0J family partition protein n=1 Tax=Paractinoplanes hotanensis TaxID=2906497 RepID=A0ABT0Y834_9ACTN|nr:ParB/RepB/Spo0J family partition protein [Actinoplanes hotanensis]MCM4082208.1 ParB/RepB/Spo0J family partition protein [Actinoplanes hotanensis]